MKKNGFLGHFEHAEDLQYAAVAACDGTSDWDCERRFTLPNGHTLYVFPQAPSPELAYKTAKARCWGTFKKDYD